MIYKLYGGESSDGMGSGKYQGITLSRKKALMHFRNCKSNPYSTGRVVALSDDQDFVITNEDQLK